MKKDIIITTGNQETALAVLSGKTNLLAERVTDGIVIVPMVAEATWLPVFLKERDDAVLMLVDDPMVNKGIWQRIHEDSDSESYYELPKDELLALCDQYDQTIFELAAILDKNPEVEPEQIVRGLLVLSEVYALENVFVLLSGVQTVKVADIFNQEDDTMILKKFRSYCIPKEEDGED